MRPAGFPRVDGRGPRARPCSPRCRSRRPNRGGRGPGPELLELLERERRSVSASSASPSASADSYGQPRLLPELEAAARQSPERWAANGSATPSGHGSTMPACRRLTRDLDATTAVVLVLACGIGLSVAMFAVADTVLRRPLPILDQERVVVLWGKRAGACARCRSPLSTSSAFESETRTLQEVAGTVSIDSWAQSVRDGEQTFRVNVSPVTGNFFVVLGAKAALGRALVPDDDHPGAAPVAVLSYSLWRGQFARNPGVLGRRLELRNSRVVTVVGVAPAGVEFPRGTELWVPFANLSAGEVVPLGRLSSHATARRRRRSSVHRLSASRRTSGAACARQRSPCPR